MRIWEPHNTWHISVDGLATSFPELLEELIDNHFKPLHLDLSTSDIVYKETDDIDLLKTIIIRHLDESDGKAIVSSINIQPPIIQYINYPDGIKSWITPPS